MRNVLVVLAASTFAFGVLFASVMRTASVKYNFNESTMSGSNVLGESDVDIDYTLPYTGKVLPDHFLWPLKALRDKAWLLITTNPVRKLELKLLFADKRLGSAKALFDKGKYELGFSVLTKAEKYLEEAVFDEQGYRQKKIDTNGFLPRVNLAALKHYEVMGEMAKNVPDDAKPKIIELQSYPRRVYELSRDTLYEKGLTPADNPFKWQ